MGFPRVLAVFAAVTALMAGCGHTSERPKSAPASSLSAKAIPPARPACGDPAAMLAAMSTRDKLAQLLMVGVRNGDDAKAVVADHHVGGIFIGSWTDLSMLSNGMVKTLSASTALPVAVSVDEEGGRVARLSSLIPYGFVNSKSADYVSPKQLEQLPSAPAIRSQLLNYNYDWWVDNRDTVIGRWNKWILA